MPTIDLAKLRAWWSHRQGLDGTLTGSKPAEVLNRTGWARSVGGSNPYLTLYARAGTRRSTADAAVEALDIYELPTARGCTYVVPAEHFALGLHVGRAFAGAELKVLERLGVPRSEVDGLGQAVLSTLESSGPLDPTQLKDALGDRVRNLGDAGRKKGASTTLPAALGMLQAEGRIRRVPVNGRLDQQRYAYVRWDAPSSTRTDGEARGELARLYFDWTGPASMAHFRWFSAFSAAQAKEALAGLDLVDVGDGLLAPPAVADEYASYQAPKKPTYSLLAGIDALILLRRDVPSLLDAAATAAPVPGEKIQAGGLSDLPDHAIVDRGRLIGLWQYDAAEAEVVTWLFPGVVQDKALAAAVERTRDFVRDDLGDARSFSLDSPKSRGPRIAALRGATSG